MEEIIKKETMTSLEIATVTGKQLQHVLRDIVSARCRCVQFWTDLLH